MVIFYNFQVFLTKPFSHTFQRDALGTCVLYHQEQPTLFRVHFSIRIIDFSDYCEKQN